MAYDRSLRRALRLRSRRLRVRCPHLRWVPRGRGNPLGVVCAALAKHAQTIPTLTEHRELCSRSAHVYCPTYLRFLLTLPQVSRVAD